MKILFFESSEGFSSYTHCLANSTKVLYPDTEVLYLTPCDNKYLAYVRNDVKLYPALLDYRKMNNRIVWFFNRMYVSIKNLIIRNQMVRKEKPDFISIQCTTPIIDQYLLKGIKGKTKIVYSAHDVIPPLVARNWSKKSLSRIYHTADHIIVHSMANKKQMIDLFSIPESKITVIHHGLKTEYQPIDRATERTKFGIRDDEIVFLFYGLIRPQKGLDILIEALHSMKNVKLIIAGAMPNGEDFSYYEDLLTKHNINCIKFIEFISEEYANVLFQVCDVVALPYRYFYSQSGVFMQAIQYHKPVIVSDTGSFSEYISKYQFGLLCKPNDVESLREACRVIVEHEVPLSHFTNKMSEAAQDNSWERSAQMHMEVFHALRP